MQLQPFVEAAGANFNPKYIFSIAGRDYKSPVLARTAAQPPDSCSFSQAAPVLQIRSSTTGEV